MIRQPKFNASRGWLLAAMVLTSLSLAHAETPEPASADLFEREALKLLKASHAGKRGIVVHVNGQSITGIVKAIGPDVVILANREYDSIVVRREKIDAVEAN